MTERGVVFDLGYKPHEGPRLGRSAAVRTTFLDGLRRIFGIRRRARKKVLPFLLFGIALLPAIVFIGLVFLTTQLAAGDLFDTPFANHATYFDLTVTVVLLFSALAAPELLIPDRVDGVLAVYSSRPLTVGDYLLARAGALAAAVAGFMLLPQLLLYVGFAALEPGGLLSNLAGNLDQAWRILVATLVFVVGFGSPALLVAVYAKRLAPATGVFVALMIGPNAVASGLVSSGNDMAGVVAIADHPLMVRDWVFGQTGSTVPAVAGLDPWVSLAVIVVIAGATGLAAMQRYRKLL